MKLTMPLLAASALMLSSSPAAAQDASGGPTALQLIQTCAKGADSGRITDPTCTGYFAGFIGALRIAQTVSNDFPICLPAEGLNNNRLVASLSDYLEKNEPMLQRSARSVVFRMLSEQYPC